MAATHELAIQETIDPVDLAAGWLFDDAKWASCVAAIRRMDHLKGHERAASNRHWNSFALRPWAKKVFGSKPSGKETMRALKPCSLSRDAKCSAACCPLPLASASKVR